MNTIKELETEIHQSKTLIMDLEDYLESAPSDGFCLAFHVKSYDLWTIRRKNVLTSWEHYSGRTAYPVVCDVPNDTEPFEYAEMQYYAVSSSKTLNFLDGKYGELRKDLIRHVTAYFKERINMLNVQLSCLTYLNEPSPVTGLCNHIGVTGNQDTYRYFRHQHLEIYSTWLQYSLNSDFPVPCPRGNDPVRAYTFYTDKLEGRYGELRKDLIHHILKYFEAKLTIN